MTRLSWFELRSRWRRQQYSHFDTACQRPKGKLHFSFAIMMSSSILFLPSAGNEYKNTLHATAPLLYPCWRYTKCLWGLYSSPPRVAMAVVGWFLFFPTFFFFLEKGFFFHTRLTQKKKLYATCGLKKNSVEKNPIFATIKIPDLRQKKKASYGDFHNRAMLSSVLGPLSPFPSVLP